MKYQDVIPEQAQNTILCTVNFKKNVATSEIVETFKDFCERLHPTINSMKIRFPYDNFKFSMGIGADAWGRLFPQAEKPNELKRFSEIKGMTKTAVSTAGDLFFHIRAEKMDVCYEMMLVIHMLLKDVIDAVDETMDSVSVTEELYLDLLMVQKIQIVKRQKMLFILKMITIHIKMVLMYLHKNIVLI